MKVSIHSSSLSWDWLQDLGYVFVVTYYYKQTAIYINDKDYTCIANLLITNYMMKIVVSNVIY